MEKIEKLVISMHKEGVEMSNFGFNVITDTSTAVIILNEEQKRAIDTYEEPTYQDVITEILRDEIIDVLKSEIFGYVTIDYKIELFGANEKLLFVHYDDVMINDLL